MKWILSIVGVALVCFGIFFFGGQKQQTNNEYMRIHVVANSTSKVDENMKYVVKDAVVDFLSPLLSNVSSKPEAQKTIVQNLQKINEVANMTLKKEGMTYLARVYVSNEKFPLRAYANLVLEEGLYDCLKIDLGDANGDNWWCVVFPSVCFVN